MGEKHEIQSVGSLHVIEQGATLSYRFNDGGGTMMVLTTTPSPDALNDVGVSKFNGARVKVTIEIDYEGTEYEGVKVR